MSTPGEMLLIVNGSMMFNQLAAESKKTAFNVLFADNHKRSRDDAKADQPGLSRRPSLL